MSFYGEKIIKPIRENDTKRDANLLDFLHYSGRSNNVGVISN